jgi:hypothetical protein
MGARHFYASLFQPVDGKLEKAFLLTGPNAYESALLDLMERIVKDYPTLRSVLAALAGRQGAPPSRTGRRRRA